MYCTSCKRPNFRISSMSPTFFTGCQDKSVRKNRNSSKLSVFLWKSNKFPYVLSPFLLILYHWVSNALINDLNYFFNICPWCVKTLLNYCSAHELNSVTVLEEAKYVGVTPPGYQPSRDLTSHQSADNSFYIQVLYIILFRKRSCM